METSSQERNPNVGKVRKTVQLTPITTHFYDNKSHVEVSPRGCQEDGKNFTSNIGPWATPCNGNTSIPFHKGIVLASRVILFKETIPVFLHKMK